VQTSPIQRDNNELVESLKTKNNMDMVTLGGINSLQEIKSNENLHFNNQIYSQNVNINLSLKNSIN
jgi:hypothetical protein